MKEMYKVMRTVVLEHSHEKYRNENESFFEETYMGLEWLLAKAPEENGTQIGDCHVCVRGSQRADFPSIAAVYTFGRHTVQIHGIKLFDIPTDDQ